MKVACIQMNSSNIVEDNITSAVELIKEAAKNRAELICTPEMTSLLEPDFNQLLKKTTHEDNDKALSVFKKLAKELSVFILIGSLPIKVGSDKCANRSFLISNEGIVLKTYDKIHMFDVNLGEGHSYKESDRYQSGHKIALTNINDISVGMTICYDVRFPHLYRDIALAGADLIAVPSAFTKITGQAHWHVLLRARAIETGSFIIAPAQVGIHTGGRETFGHSMIVNPWGEIVAETAKLTPDIIYADINSEEVDEARRKIPNLINTKEYKK